MDRTKTESKGMLLRPVLYSGILLLSPCPLTDYLGLIPKLDMHMATQVIYFTFPNLASQNQIAIKWSAIMNVDSQSAI